MGLLCALRFCDARKVVLEALSKIGSHEHSSIWLMALRFITRMYGLLPLDAVLYAA